MELLRPVLYEQLRRVFGRVRVGAAGETCRWSVRPSSVDGKPERFLDARHGDTRGETYKVCCPYCNDCRYRLWIPHMWGHLDPATGRRNLWLARCFNEDCLDSYIQQYVMLADINWFASSGQTNLDQVRTGRVRERKPGEVEWPGAVWPINRLPEDHHAVRYLAGRNFDLDVLWDRFRVGYLLEPTFHYRHLRDRIVIPVFLEGNLVGWQARYIGDKVPDGVVKYYSMDNMQKSHVLYNFDSAACFPFVVAMEGPPNVWRFGPEGVASFGELSPFHISLLASRWPTIILMMDNDGPDTRAVLRSREVLSILQQSQRRVIAVNLPEKVDPADFQTTDELRRFVAHAAAPYGVVIN